jgi:hypothetical protein
MSTADLISEFETIYLLDNEFSEDIVYNILDIVAKPIRAVIYRNGYHSYRQFGDRGAGSMPSKYDLSVAISKGSINGILSVIEKSDTINAYLNTGDIAMVKFRVTKIYKQDFACWYLGLLK